MLVLCQRDPDNTYLLRLLFLSLSSGLIMSGREQRGVDIRRTVSASRTEIVITKDVSDNVSIIC